MLERRVFGGENEYGLTAVLPNAETREQKPLPSDNRLTNMVRRFIRTRPYGGKLVYLGSMGSNGSRLYDDHSHPEYSTPEVTSIVEYLKYDFGGDRIVSDVCEDALTEKEHEEDPELRGPLIEEYTLTRRVATHDKPGERKKTANGTEREDSSWGAHGDFMVLRSAMDPQKAKSAHAKAWGKWGLFVGTRESVVGQGGIYQTADGEYNMGTAQKAPHLRCGFGTETTLNKAVVNLRDIPYANKENYARVHDTSGDPNISGRIKYMRVGGALITLALIEEEIPLRLPDDFEYEDDELLALALHTAVDTTCRKSFEFRCGYRATAVEISSLYMEAAQVLEDRGLLNDELVLARQLWLHDLGKIAVEPILLFGKNEWVTRKAYLARKYAGHIKADNVPWAYALADDIAFDRVVPEGANSFLRGLREKGVLAEMMPSREAMTRSWVEPPRDTRAYDRGRLVSHFVAKGADSDGGGNWQTLQLRPPYRPTQLSDDPRIFGDPEVERILAGQWRRN